MAKFLYFVTHGTDDPTRAAWPLFLAGGAATAGHEPRIILALDGVLLMKDTIVQNIQGVGMEPTQELMDTLISNRVPILV